MEAEIRQLEERIKTEKEKAAKVQEIIENLGMYHCNSISFILYLSGSLWRVKAWGRRQDVG